MFMRSISCKSESKGVDEFSFAYPCYATVAEFIEKFTETTILKWLVAYLDVKVQAFARAVAAESGVASAITQCQTWEPGTSAKNTAAVENAAQGAKNAMLIAIAQQCKSGMIPRETALALGCTADML